MCIHIDIYNIYIFQVCADQCEDNLCIFVHTFFPLHCRSDHISADHRGRNSRTCPSGHCPFRLFLFIRFVENSPVGKMHYLKSIQEEAARSGGRKVGWYWILVQQFDVSIQIFWQTSCIQYVGVFLQFPDP